MQPRGIALVGLRGSGKTRLGGLLAEKMGWNFLDSDTHLAEVHGEPVGSLLGRLGEGAFRAAEGQALLELLPRLRQGNLVLALGGGSLEDAKVVELLEDLRGDSGWLCVWLEASPREMAHRIGEEGDRPRITGGDAQEEARLLLARRAPTFLRCQDLRFRNPAGDPEERAEELLARIRAFLKGKAGEHDKG